MPDDNAGNGENNNQGAPNGSDPKKTESEAPTSLDLSKISDDEFGKVFEDKRLFNHPRFKELAEAKQQLKKQQDEQAQKEEERLKKQGEFEQLANKNKEEAVGWQNKFKTAITDNKILAEAQKAGVVDTEAVLKLVDRSTIAIDDNGVVSGVEDAVKKLVGEKTYLVNGKPNPNIGAGANPQGANQSVKRFKHSEIQDPAFFAANEKDIMAAMKAGMIEDDLKR